MEFYQENKINPLASCVPLLLQLPVFFALFSLLRSDEFNDEINAAATPGFLFIPNLDEPATGAALGGPDRPLLRDHGRLDLRSWPPRRRATSG